MAPLDTRTIHIIGVRMDLGGGRRGVDMGPSALRIAGIGEQLALLGHNVFDHGDVDTPIPETRTARDEKKRFIKEIAKVCQKVYQLCGQALAKGGVPIVLGGDHSIAAGSAAAAADFAYGKKERQGLLWIDAHGDMNTPESSGSGNVHGMPLAALLGNEPSELSTIGGRAPKYDAANTVLIGVRNLDEREKEQVMASRVRVFTMKDIDRLGIATVMEQALAYASAGTTGIHVSFDLDACDPSIAPGVGTPVKGGLDYREAHMVMEMIADSKLMTSLDLVEVNPVLDMQNQTAVLGAELALSALGMKIL